MIQLQANQITDYAPAVDTLIQNVSGYSVNFRTDSTDEVWGIISPMQTLEVPANKAIQLKCWTSVELATLNMNPVSQNGNL